MNPIKRLSRTIGCYLSAITLFLALGLCASFDGRWFFWLIALLLIAGLVITFLKQRDKYLSKDEIDAFLRENPDARPFIAEQFEKGIPFTVGGLNDIWAVLCQQRVLKRQHEARNRILKEQREALK